MNQVFPYEHPNFMYLSKCWHGVMIELSLRCHEGRVDKFVDRELDVSLYCLERMRHESALASKLVTELRDVRLKEVNLRLTFPAHRSDQMIHASGVVRGVPSEYRVIFLSVFVGVDVLAEGRVQEVSGDAVDWCISGSRM